MMHITLYWSRYVTLLFDSWPSYLLFLAACFLVSAFYQYMEDRRVRFRSLASSSAAASPLLLKAGASWLARSARLEAALLFGLNSAISYLLMLAIMSFNGGVFLAIVAGLTVGYYVFRNSESKETAAPAATAMEAVTAALASTSHDGRSERGLMAVATGALASSSHVGRLGRGHEVFLSFRGPDTRLTIADSLYKAIERAAIRVFKDDEELRVGKEIGGNLMQAINESRIYIPIFSKNYASSKWCLRELAHIVKLSRDDTEKVILPIFSDVDADDVKLKTELYRTALQKHESDSGKDMAKQWEEALKEIARIKGWNLKDYGLYKLTNLMVEEVSNLLWTRRMDMSNRLVGIKDRMDHIMKLLDVGAFDVRFIVIHGMGGIGKTTLAEAVFRQIYPQFQDHCCFLKDVRTHDIIDLQKKLLFDILNLGCTNPFFIDEVIKTRFLGKKVLVVLDDIDNWDQITRLAGEPNWFGGGSRIIITTRNIEFLVEEGEDDNLPVSNSGQFSFYDMPEMNSHDALQLFCERALGCAQLPPSYMDITKELINALGGLPLALSVVGSTLRGKCRRTWEVTLCKLKKVMNDDVKKKLMISYEALGPNQRQIYLDIACFCFNKEKTTAVKYWDAIFGYPTEIEVNILKHMSLIKISNNNKLWMHDQLRDLGRSIVHPESGEIHMKGSRLWSPKDAFHVVQTEMGTGDIVVLNLVTVDPNKTYRFKQKQFAGLVNLRFLQLDHGNFEGDFKNGFYNLRWLSWSNCPSKFQATNFGLKNLTILTLSGNNITEDWGGWCQFMVAKQLKILQLNDCPFLRKTPKFFAILQLEKLILRCLRLRKIDESICNLKHLDYLEIKSEAIESLPESIGGLKSLTVLRIDRTPSMVPHSIGNLAKVKSLILPRRELQKLPDSIGQLESLLELDVRYLNISELPHSIGNLETLKVLCISNSYLIEKLPDSIRRLQSLVELDLSNSRIRRLPNCIGNLKRLQVLCCWGCYLEDLPDSIGRLQSLVKLNLSNSRIRRLPDCIGNLKRLQVLCCWGCYLEDLPDSIGRLQSLVKLDLSNSRIRRLPDCIGNLKRLEQLNLNDSISELPKTIGMLENLKELNVQSRHLEREIPSEIGALSLLYSLNLSYGRFSGLPTTINRLTNLKTLCLHACDSIQQLPELPESLWELTLSSESLTTIFDCSNLTNLVFLDVTVKSMQELKTEGIVRLLALRELVLHVGKLALPPTDFSSLSQLRMLDISCAEPQSLIGLPSSLKYLYLKDVQSPINWLVFSNLENLSVLSIDGYSPREIRFEVLGELRKLNKMWMSDYPLLKTLPVLPGLKEIRYLHLSQFPQLTKIQGLGELKLLEHLTFSGCNSIKSLNESDLSNLQNLYLLSFDRCESLESVLGMPKSCDLFVTDCPKLNRDG